MKVLHILNSLATGGAEKLVADTVPLYNKKGITTDVLVFQNNDYAFHRALESAECCKIYNLNTSSVYNPISIFKMMPIIRQYDIVHAHLFPGQYYLVLSKIFIFSKTKLIFTEHNTTNRRLENKIFKAIDKWIYKFYDQIIAISPEIQQMLIGHTGFTKKRIQVIENGVKIESIVQAKPYNKSDIHPKIQESDKLMIQVAGFREQKDQETLIKAMALTPADFKLVLVGEGITKERCQTLVQSLKLQDRVFFLGIRTDIPNLLKTANVVVLASHFEGMSLSSIEGMASGKPFVASDVPGLHEMVNGHGVLFEDKNEKQLADSLIALLNNDSYYKKVANACVEHAKKFDIQIMVDKHIELYQEVYVETTV